MFPEGMLPEIGAQQDRRDRPAVSVVVPVKNESGNIAPLVTEISAALQNGSFEVVYVNDGSTDATEQELRELMAQRPWLRQIRHDKSCGQSAAIRSGVAMARGEMVVTIDGDGQNDPAFIPALVTAFEVGAPRVGPLAIPLSWPSTLSAALVRLARTTGRSNGFSMPRTAKRTTYTSPRFC